MYICIIFVIVCYKPLLLVSEQVSREELSEEEQLRKSSPSVVLGAKTRLPNREMDRKRRANGDATPVCIPISPASVHLPIRETGVRTKNDGAANCPAVVDHLRSVRDVQV